MKATRKKEYSEKRKRKLTEREISELKLQQHNEIKDVQTLVSIKIDERTSIHVTQSKFNKYGKQKCIELWKERQMA